MVYNSYRPYEQFSLPPVPETYRVARGYWESGLNVLPVWVDGSKQPAVPWKPFISRRMTSQEVSRHFGWFHRGIGIVCGATSGNLEVIDFDDRPAFLAWYAGMYCNLELRERLVYAMTPDNGRHAYYRCSEVEGNQVLAGSEAGVTLIETRGQGGYVVAPGSPKGTHPSKRFYRLICGKLKDIPSITPDERQQLFQVARELNKDQKRTAEWEQKRDAKPKISSADLRGFYGIDPSWLDDDPPGEWFNRHGVWEEILLPAGWSIVGYSGDVTEWLRPGKGYGISATTNHMGLDLLHVFSTSVSELEAGRSYDKFGVFARLYHGGNLSEAASALHEKRELAKI